MTAAAASVAPVASATPAQLGGWPVAETRPLGCVTVREATRRACNSEHYTGSKVFKAVWSWVHRLALTARGNDPGPCLFGGVLWVPASLHAALAEPAAPELAARTLKVLPAGRRARAAAKLRALDDFKVFHRFGEGRGLGKADALQRYVEQRGGRLAYHDGPRERTLKLSVRSLQRWELQRYAGGLDALAKDGRGRRRASDDAGPSAEAARFYLERRHDPRKFSIAACWRFTASAANARGWRWFESLAACRSWDARTRDTRALTLNRRGERAYTAEAGPYLASDPESFAPAECWESDHTTVNAWVALPSGAIVRPVLTAWLDWRSRALVGWSLAVTGNSETILVAFRNGARRFGLPSFAVMDNGRDFAAYIWTGGRPKRQRGAKPGEFVQRVEGIFAQLGVTPRWVLPYSPNSKPRIERFFRTFDDQFARNWPSYCGSTPENRPEAHKVLVEKAVPFTEFARAAGAWFELYNATPHGGEGMNDRTPLQVMALAERRRVLSDEQATFLLAAWPRPVKIGRHGVAVRIAGATLRYGAFSRELNALAIGTPVRVAYDPADSSGINVWAADGRFICRAEENHRFNRRITTEELRAALREKAAMMRKLREVRRNGLVAFSDPVTHALAAQAEDAARRRLPDPTPPAGGPLLIPVQTPFEAPPKPAETLRRAVGAPDVLADVDARLLAVTQRWATETRRPRGERPADLLDRLAKGAAR